ncbi:MAG: sensor histidine kinase [Dictyoglomus sp.]
MVINLNKLELKSILSQTTYDTFLINSDGAIVFSNNEKFIGKRIDIDWQKLLLENGYSLTYEGKKYRVFGVYLPLSGYNKDFYLISMVPLGLIMKEPIRMQYFAFTIILLAFLTSIILTVIFSKSMSKRIALLNKAVEEISHGNWDLDVSIEGKDEIGELSKNVKSMARSIKALNELVMRQKDMKFKVLTNQLNPHFLFNTLETIHMMAVCNGQREIANIVLKLGKILRKTIESKGTPIKLESEIDLVKNYLEIQKYRLGRLNYEIEILTDIEEIYVLPFLIQPIVENSIIHGLENKTLASS